MGLFQNHMMAAAVAATADVTYTIDNSCRFNFADSPYLTRTPGAASNRRTWTMSYWYKLCQLASTASDGLVWFHADSTEIKMLTSNNHMSIIPSAGETNQVFTDMAAWQHIVIAVDTTDATTSNRVKLYINGSLVTSYATASSVSENYDWAVNNTVAHEIGKEGSNYFNGYMADFCLIDGTQNAVTDFGKTNDEGVWIPIKLSGLTFGTNGFLLNFASSGDLGNDVSGNNNDYSSSGLAAVDQSTDTPTNNHCIWNGIYQLESSITLSEGNKGFLNSAGSQDKVQGTFLPTSGKWYWEIKWESESAHGQIGLMQNDQSSNKEPGDTDSPGTGASLGYRSYDGKTYKDRTLTTYGDTWTTGDIIGVAWDADNEKVYFSKNGTWQNSGDPAAETNPAYDSLSTASVDGGGWGPCASNESSTLYIARFTEAEWDYSAPSGFNALNSANLTAPAVTDSSTNFQTQLYTGNGTAIGSGGKTVTFTGNSDMQPDIVWIKNRDQGDNHTNYDAARGTTKQFDMNDTGSESTQTEGVTTFGSDGFTVGSLAAVNTSDEDYVSWCWSAGNSGASNTAGSINTTTTYVDTAAGISISTYTGNGSDGATVGHGLGVAPEVVLIIPLSNGDHHLICNWEAGITAFTEKFKFNDSEAASTSASQMTGGSSTTFTLSTDPNVNGSSRTYVAYVFAEVEGFSRFGTYTGNGNSNGPFVYCGFEPQLIIIKSANQAEGWPIFDASINPYNYDGTTGMVQLFVNNSNVEVAGNNENIDILSNGFKLRGTNDPINSSNIYVFMAFAKHPFGGDGVSPSTAR